MKPVFLASLAEADLAVAQEWYEAEREGLGTRFIDRFWEVARDIGDLPLRHPVIEGDVRRAQMWPFPYGIYFRDLSDRVLIIAVTHLRRHPTSWRHSH